ncbi:hypothetical protein JW935_08405 [candidate division KSB1 bacterium]|nr:hypothetical protein [candidate division KSB1 bacterium]
MSENLNDGDSFLFPIYPGQNQEHLWIVLNTPDDDNECVIVSISTLRDNTKDKTVILECGEHKFIKDKSFVAYHKAQIINAVEFCSYFKSGIARLSNKINIDTLNRIKKGIFNSKFTPNKVRRFCQFSIRFH